MKTPLLDNHGRPINYVRLSVTDKCNLRCFYCMPSEKMPFLPNKSLLSIEEMCKICAILADNGINKIRITGGEPFMRIGIEKLLRNLRQILPYGEITITTNGLLTQKYIPLMKELGINKINLSLDTLDEKQFYDISRRNDFNKVWETFHLLLAHDFQVKLNAVVMTGINTNQIIPIAKLTETYPIDVRFIEEMPFNGVGQRESLVFFNHKAILNLLHQNFENLQALPLEPFATSANYGSENLKGKIGIIAAFSRTFCGTCNRIRITADGKLKTCLYDEGVLDLKKIIRENPNHEYLTQKILATFQNRAKDGFEAEKNRHEAVNESMSAIGG